MPDQFVFATELPVRITDVNYGNHLGNDAVLSVLHEARMRFLAQFGYSEANVRGVGMLMVDAAVQYRSQSSYGDPLRIEVTTEDWTRSGFDLLYRITNTDTGREVARAKTGMRFFDYAEGRVARVPDGVQLQLEQA